MAMESKSVALLVVPRSFFDRDLHLEEAVQHSAHSGLIYSAVKAVIEA